MEPEQSTSQERVLHLTTAELAERWRTSIAVLANLRYKGGGPRFIKLGRKVLYPMTEIERHERERLRAANSVPVK
jgi:hypothetical protein